MLVEVKREIGGKILQGSSHPKLKEQLESFMDKFVGILEDNLKDKINIKLGMNVFTIVEKDGIYVVTAPNYIGNPRKEITLDLTPSLQILVEQTYLLSKLGIKGESVMFYDTVLIYDEVWKHERIQMQKMPIDKAKNNDSMSGWVINRYGDTELNLKKMKKCYVFDLFKLKPTLLKALTLPTNYKAVFKEDILQAVYDADNKNILK